MKRKLKIVKFTPSKFNEDEVVVSMSPIGNSPIAGFGRTKGVFTIFNKKVGDYKELQAMAEAGTIIELPEEQIKPVVNSEGKSYDWFMA